ncbi:MAG: Ser-Thr-rich GPI-anchored membrane family protein [Cyclobacteriaceae bacterium]
MKNSLLILATIFIGCACSYGQSVDIDWIELAGDKVVVHYNLDDANPTRQYLVNLFSSKDNFTSPLMRVTGDVGTEVNSGADRKITWDVTKELGEFKGNLSFEVRGRIFVPFVRLTDFDEGKVFKRGKNYPITWSSGNKGGQVNIELYNDRQERVWGESNLPNSERFDWYVPSVSKGSGYRLKFTNTKDRNEIQYSQPFAIKPKVPMLLKAVAIAAAGGGIFILTSGKKTESGAAVPETSLGDYPNIPN